MNILLLVGIAGVGVLAAWIVKSGGRGGETALSPEDTVRAFYSALLAGDWEGADRFCADTEYMETYCRRFMDFWEKSMSADSSMLAAASGMIEEAGMTLSDGSLEKRDLYRTRLDISVEGCPEWSRMVELEKEGRVWLLSRIDAVQ